MNLQRQHPVMKLQPKGPMTLLERKLKEVTNINMLIYNAFEINPAAATPEDETAAKRTKDAASKKAERGH